MRRAVPLLLAVFAAVVVVCAVWIGVDRRPPEWDHANHLERAVLCARDLAAGDLASLLDRSSFYPPLVLCTAGALYQLLPSDAVAGQIVIWLFLGLGMAATWGLGRRVGGDIAGVAAAVLFGTAPFVVFSALRFQLDLPLAALVALALWALLATEGFTRRGPAMLTGVLFGLGMLTKPSFAVYVLPAVVLSLRHVRRGGVLLNMALTGLVTTVLALPWYGPRAFGMVAQVGARSGKQAAESGHPDPFSWPGLSFYPTWLAPQFGVLAVLLLLAGILVAVRRGHGVVLVSVLVPFVLFALIRNKNLRYTLPILPAAAVLAGLAFATLGPRSQRILAVALGVVAVAQVSATAFGVPPARPVAFGIPWVLADPPRPGDWKQREVLAVLARESGAARATVSVVPNASHFSVSNFRYYALRDGLTLRFVRAWDEGPLGVDFMVLKTGEQGPVWTAEKPRRIAERLATDEHLARAFPVIAEVGLPDGSTATVRARRIPPHPAAPGAIAEAVEAAVRNEVSRFARDVDGLAVTLEWDADIARGRIRKLVVTARIATVGELKRRDAATLRLRDLRLAATDVVVNPGSAWALGRLDVLDVGRIVIEQAEITQDDLGAFLHGLKRFRRASLTLEDGAALVRLPQTGPDVSARIRILPAPDRPFALAAADVRLGGVPLPQALVSWVIRHYDPTPRLAARLPVPVEIGDVAIAPDAIRIRVRKEAR